MTSYGKIEIMEADRYSDEAVFDVDVMLDNRWFPLESPSISRCIHRPDGMIGLSARHLSAHYELQFREQTHMKRRIDEERGYYSISVKPFSGTGRVIRLYRFEKPEPFLQFYHIITVSNRVGHRLVWRIGIASFSKEVTEEGV